MNPTPTNAELADALEQLAPTMRLYPGTKMDLHEAARRLRSMEGEILDLKKDLGLLKDDREKILAALDSALSSPNASDEPRPLGAVGSGRLLGVHDSRKEIK